MKAWFFIHCCGEKGKNHIIFCSSRPLKKNSRGYDFDTGESFDSFIFNRSENEEMYDFILEKVERINPMDVS